MNHADVIGAGSAGWARGLLVAGKYLKDETMVFLRAIRCGLVVLPALCTATVAEARLESNELASSIEPDMTTLECDRGFPSDEAKMCDSALLRWRLCERGLQSDGPGADESPGAGDVSECFLKAQ